jgi:hypothetical protein
MYTYIYIYVFILIYLYIQIYVYIDSDYRGVCHKGLVNQNRTDNKGYVIWVKTRQRALPR